MYITSIEKEYTASGQQLAKLVMVAIGSEAEDITYNMSEDVCIISKSELARLRNNLSTSNPNCIITYTHIEKAKEIKKDNEEIVRNDIPCIPSLEDERLVI